MYKLRQFLCWLKRVVDWMLIPKLFWLSFVTIFLICIPLQIFGASELIFRLSGLVLQCFSILTVIWGIHITRSQFNQPSLTSVVVDWLKRFPTYHKGKTIMGELSGENSSTGRLEFKNWDDLHENPTLEDRVHAAEKNLNILRSSIKNMHNRIDEQNQAQNELLKKESSERLQEVSKLRDSILNLGTGGLHISAIGAFWLFVGVVLSTTAPELEKLLNISSSQTRLDTSDCQCHRNNSKISELKRRGAG